MTDHAQRARELYTQLFLSSRSLTSVAHDLSLIEAALKQAAQPVWNGEKPTVAGGYWVRHLGCEQVMSVKEIEGCGFVVGPYYKPLEECEGWQFAGPLPAPREASCQK